MPGVIRNTHMKSAPYPGVGLTVPANNVVGTGTVDTIPIWTGAQTLGDSLISQIAGNVFINGKVGINEATPATEFQLTVKKQDVGTQPAWSIHDDLLIEGNFAIIQLLGLPTNSGSIGFSKSGAGAVRGIGGIVYDFATDIMALRTNSAEAVRIDANGNLHIVNQNELRFYDNGNYVGFEAPALTGDQIWVLPFADGVDGDALVTDGAGTLAWASNASEKTWALSEVSGAGTHYIGGYYDFAASDNDFNPATTHGTANSSYAAHVFLVQAVGAGGGDTTIQISGTSIDDQGNRDATPDTEDIIVSDAGAAGTYYETTKKWIGQVTLTKTAGPDLLCNFGFCKYWDNNNTNYTVKGIEATWTAGANDATPNILLRHHSATGWTYNNGAAPTPPAAITDMNTDHVVEIQLVDGENGAWKRDNLNTDIEGSGIEGTIIELVTNQASGKSFEIGNILVRIVPQ